LDDFLEIGKEIESKIDKSLNRRQSHFVSIQKPLRTFVRQK